MSASAHQKIVVADYGINSTVVISRRYDVPYLAGASKDGRTVYIDRRVPRKLAIKRKNGKGYLSVAPDQFLAVHETVEHRLMVHSQMPYLKAHAIATQVEKKAVEAAGVDWKSYEVTMDGLLAHIEHEKPRRAPPDLYLKPYPHDKKELLKKLAVRSRAEGGPLEADPNAPDPNANPWDQVPVDASGRPVIYVTPQSKPSPNVPAPGAGSTPPIDKTALFAPPSPATSLPLPQNRPNINGLAQVAPISPINAQGSLAPATPVSDTGTAGKPPSGPPPAVSQPHKPTPDEIYAWERGEPAPATPEPPTEHTRSILDKLLGIGGPRYQLFPERIIRSGFTAPGEVLATGQLTQRDPYGRIIGTEPEMSVGSTSTDVAAPPAGFPSETAIQRSQDIAALQFSGGAGASEEGAVGAAGGQLDHEIHGRGWREGYQSALDDRAAGTRVTPMTGEQPYTRGWREGYEAAWNRQPGTALMTEAGKPGAVLAAAEHSPFYSAAEQAITNAKQNKMTPDQWIGWLKNQPGVKPEELQWFGLGDKRQLPEELQSGPITRDQLLAHLKENQVQPRLVEKSGEPEIEDDPDGAYEALRREFLDTPPYPSEDAFDEWLDTPEGRARLEELETRRGNEGPKYSNPNLSLPGGQNYRETLVTLPPAPIPYELSGERQIEIANRLEAIQDEFNRLHEVGQRSIHGDQQLYEQRAALAREKDQLKAEQRRIREAADRGVADTYKSTHWDEPNVLLHLRMNDREIPIEGEQYKLRNKISGNTTKPFDSVAEAEAHRTTLPQSLQPNLEVVPVGKRSLQSLHLEELQSDWHQKGRKQGYDDPVARAAAEKKLNDAGYPISNEDAAAAFREGIINRDELQSIRRSYIPDAPFKTTWPDLGLKTAIAKAAREGKDAISWTPGEQQAERYDLSKQISKVTLHSDPKGNRATLVAFDHNGASILSKLMDDAPRELPDLIGKEAAQRLLDKKPEGRPETPYRELSGLDLKVGGEGMKGFYDKMLVDKANALGKKFGARVEWKELPGIARRGSKDMVVVQDERPMNDYWRAVDATTGQIIPGSPAFASEALAKRWIGQSTGVKVPVLRITPQLKEQALKGMPLFSEAGRPGAALAAAEHTLGDQAVARQLARNPGASIFDVGGRPDLNPPAPIQAPMIMKGAGSPLGIKAPQIRQLFDNVIGPYADEKEFADKYLMGMADPQTTVIMPAGHYGDDPRSISITSSLVDPKTNNRIGSIERHISPAEGSAYHAILEVSPDAPKGFTAQLLRNQIDLYNKMGLRAVDMYADVDVGSYAWAKYGWVPGVQDWNSVRTGRYGIPGRLQKLWGTDADPKALAAIPKIAANPDPKSIWDIADINAPVPRSLVKGEGKPDQYMTYTHPSTKTIGQYLLKGMGWDGRLNLFDPESMDRFNSYISGKTGTTFKTEAGKPGAAIAASERILDPYKEQWAAPKPGVWYHGTTAVRAKDIKNNGLTIPDNTVNRWSKDPELYQGRRGQAVYLVNDPRAAFLYGGIRSSGMRGLGKGEGDNPAVAEVHLTPEQERRLINDEQDPMQLPGVKSVYSLYALPQETVANVKNYSTLSERQLMKFAERLEKRLQKRNKP